MWLHLSPGDPPIGPSDFDQRPPRIARLQSINQSNQVGTDCRVRQEVSVPEGAGIFVDFDQVNEVAGVRAALSLPARSDPAGRAAACCQRYCSKGPKPGRQETNRSSDETIPA